MKSSIRVKCSSTTVLYKNKGKRNMRGISKNEMLATLSNLNWAQGLDKWPETEAQVSISREAKSFWWEDNLETVEKWSRTKLLTKLELIERMVISTPTKALIYKPTLPKNKVLCFLNKSNRCLKLNLEEDLSIQTIILQPKTSWNSRVRLLKRVRREELRELKKGKSRSQFSLFKSLWLLQNTQTKMNQYVFWKLNSMTKSLSTLKSTKVKTLKKL